ncbi:MAG: TonB-dependent receptor, plug [Edaphobacter sp.]|nr:TonB-dependent receptor, plug [Edaphobacter sp.]
MSSFYPSSKLMMTSLRGLALLVLAMAASCFSPAQEASSGISGTVFDSVHSIVPNAHVTARNVATNLTAEAVSNGSGFFEFPNLPPGEYTLTATATGFQPANSTPFTILTGQRARVDMILQVGSVVSTVDVSASAAQLVNTTSNDLGVNIEPVKIQNLPLNQRNFFALVALQPGVNASTNTSQNSRGGFEVNGAPGLSNNLLMDGIDATFGEDNGAGPGSGAYINTIGVGAIAEFRTTSSVPPAQYGRAAGGILAITTKSGANAFHGSVFEFFRNDVLDANTWVNKHQATVVPIPKLRFNEFGANLGGPVVRDKAFFFFNYEGDRVISGSSTSGNTPTAALIASVSNPSIAQELSFMPKPTSATSNPLIGLSVGNLTTQTKEDTFVSRGDLNLRKHRLLVRFNQNNQQQDIQQFRRDDFLSYPLRLYNAAIEDVWTLKSNMVNEFRLGLNRNDLARHNTTYNSDPTRSWIAITGAFSTDNNQGLLHFLTTTYNLVDNLTLIRNNHTISIGTDNRWLRSGRVQDTNNLSTYASLSNLQRDIPQQVQITFGTPKHFDSFQLGFYAEDNYRASPRLTLNYGLRYDYYTPLNGAFNVQTSDPFSPLSSNKKQPYFSENRFNFAPRLGLIFDILGDQKLVFRSGFGLMFLPPQPFFFYDSSFLDPRLPFNAIVTPADVPAGTSLAYPFSKSYVNQIASNPSLLPSDIKLGRQIANPNHADEYSENWNANLQYAIRPDLTLQATYTALRDLHGTTTTLPNQFAPHTCNPTCTVRPNNAIGNINYTIFEGRTTYDALFLQASYRKGVTSADFYYTFASGIQEWAGGNGIGTGQTDVQDLLNPAGSRGWSTGQTRNKITAAYTVSPPVPEFARVNRLGRLALEGFSFQGIVGYNTGTVGNILANVDLVRNGRPAGDRPDRVQGVSMYGTGVDSSGYPIWLNRGAFDSATPFAAQRYGNLGYNAIYGPHQVTLDMSVIRRINLYKEHSLNLRGEFFNILNHANLNNPTLTLTDANFGKVLTRSGPRNIQLGAEYRF